MLVVCEFGKRIAFGIDEIPPTIASDLGTPFSERAGIVEGPVLECEAAVGVGA
jgi:hypothetical protein